MPGLWVTPLELDLGPVGVGDTSATQTVTITNVGDATLTNFAGGGVEAPFSAAQNCAGGVPPGGSCQYFFTFAPTTTGSFSATSSSRTNGGPITVDLQGRGQMIFPVNRQLVTPLFLDFGPVGIGTTSHTLAVTITNQSFFSTITNWAGGGIGEPFSGAQNCAGGVPPAGSCQYFFTFTPTAEGRFTAFSSSSSNGGPFVIRLQGGTTLQTFLPVIYRR